MVVERVTFPVPSSVPVPMAVDPSLNVTVPAGMTVPDAAVTVVAKATLAPTSAEVGDAISVVTVATTGTALTVTATGVDVLPVKLVSPP